MSGEASTPSGEGAAVSGDREARAVAAEQASNEREDTTPSGEGAARVVATTTKERDAARVRARRLAGRVRRRLRSRGRRGMRDSLEQLRRHLERSDEQFKLQHHRIGVLEREMVRIGTQVAAIEARLEDVRQDASPVARDGDGDGDSSAAAVLDEVRREHQRVRARISAAARYEERLRQVEERVSRLSEADPSQR